MLTDLYALTMAASYFRNGIQSPVTLSLFIREYPPHLFVSHYHPANE